jgi:nicotinamidase-related amidase
MVAAEALGLRVRQGCFLTAGGMPDSIGDELDPGLPIMTNPSLMSPRDTGLLVVDVQEKLVPLVGGANQLLLNVGFLIDAARLLGVPTEATEQYPAGLGSTVAALAERLPRRYEKVDFSCGAVPDIVESFTRAGCTRIMLAGIETHVCIQQTALDLLERGVAVYVAADSVASRDRVDHEVALERMARAGVTITSAEAAVFEWTGKAGTPVFKQISLLVQDRMKKLALARVC